MLRAIKERLEALLAATAVETAPLDREHAVRLATTALMLEIARADAHVGPEEEAVVRAAAGSAFGLSPPEIEALVAAAGARAEDSVSLYDFTSVLTDRLSREERIGVVELLWQVAQADRRIDRYEEFYVRKVADLLHVGHADFIRAKLRVTGG